MRNNVNDGDSVNMEATSQCPSAEALTLIMEGKGNGRTRKAWMSHIDGCDDCRTVLAEAAAYVEDWNQRNSSERSTSWFEAFRAGIGRFQSFAPMLAAVLVVALVAPFGVVLISEQLSNGSRVSVAALTEPLFTNGSTRYSENLWRDYSSGASFASALTEEQLGFRIGVYLVDLRVALREGSGEKARDRIRELDALMKLYGPPLAPMSSLAGIGESVDALDFGSAVTRLDDIERELATDDERFLVRFGAWAEASRLAAIDGRRTFFDDATFRQSFKEIRSRELPAPASVRLQEIERRVSTEESEIELQAIGRELRGLILLY
jgi:hypothetical protein